VPVSATPGSPTKPLHDPIAPPERDPPNKPMHDPHGAPTFEPPRPLTEPTPSGLVCGIAARNAVQRVRRPPMPPMGTAGMYPAKLAGRAVGSGLQSAITPALVSNPPPGEPAHSSSREPGDSSARAPGDVMVGVAPTMWIVPAEFEGPACEQFFNL
jgi:hypothetical protein